MQSPSYQNTGIRPSIAQIASLSDFQTVFHWNIIMNIPEKIKNVGFGAVMSAETFNVRAISTSLPKQSMGSAPISIRGHTINRVTYPTYDTILTVTIIESIDAAAMIFIRSWYEVNWHTRIGTQEYFKDVCSNINLQLLDGLDNVTQEYVLYNAWISDYTVPELQGQGDFMQPTITFTFDWWEFAVNPIITNGPGAGGAFVAATTAGTANLG